MNPKSKLDEVIHGISFPSLRLTLSHASLLQADEHPCRIWAGGGWTLVRTDSGTSGGARLRSHPPRSGDRPHHPRLPHSCRTRRERRTAGGGRTGSDNLWEAPQSHSPSSSSSCNVVTLPARSRSSPSQRARAQGPKSLRSDEEPPARSSANRRSRKFRPAPLPTPRTLADYHRLRDLLEDLIERVGADESHPLAAYMDRVGTLVEQYENTHLAEIIESKQKR